MWPEGQQFLSELGEGGVMLMRTRKEVQHRPNQKYLGSKFQLEMSSTSSRMYLKTYPEYWEGMLSCSHWLICEAFEVVLTPCLLKSLFS